MPDNPSQIFVATESFVCEINGERYVVLAESTRVAAGHDLVKNHPNRFAPLEPNADFQLEAATDVPGERRARPTRRPSRQAAAATASKET